ncbi:UNVERIFIED_CONTAM: hypothetical protein FKN15_032515 [Acipenser sinensis]
MFRNPWLPVRQTGKVTSVAKSHKKKSGTAFQNKPKTSTTHVRVWVFMQIPTRNSQKISPIPVKVTSAASFNWTAAI